jgi:transposase
MMHGGHIGGQRAGAFLELVDGVDPRRVLLVGVDVAKATWFVVASNLLGEVMVDGVRLVADRAGLAELERLIAATSGQLDAAVVVVGVEAAGHHHQTLVGHLGDREGLVVRLLNPAQVAAVRKQQRNRRRKTDWLDAAAICELLARGEGSSPHLDASPAATLRPLWSGRKDLVDARGRLRQQAGALVDCLWPGFSAADRQAGVTPVVSDSFDTKAGRVVVGLLAEGWTPARVAATSVAELRALFAARGCRLSGPLAGRLIGRAASALPAHPAATAGKQATLAGLLGALAALDGQIARLEAEMAPLLAATQGAKLTQIRGVATVAAAGFVAFVGHTGRWSEWSKVWRAAGLDPARSQSGATDQSYGISREGSAWGRRAILDPAAGVCRQPGRFHTSYQARLHARKHPKVALAAVGNQVGRTCFALMGSGADYDPDHQAKRIPQRTGNQPKAGGRAA